MSEFELVSADGLRKGGVALAYCYGELIRPQFMSSVLGVITHDRGRRVQGTVAVGCLYICEGRNYVVQQFLQSGLEWLWFLDTDVEFAPDTLDRLLEATKDGERKIVSAPYWTEDENGPFVVWYRLDPEGFRAYAEIPESGVVQLAACGMGCCLIHRDVFASMVKDRHNPDDPWVWFSHDLVEMATGPIRAGEDFSFCLRAYKRGFPTYGVTDIRVDHYKVRAQLRPKPRLMVPA